MTSTDSPQRGCIEVVSYKTEALGLVINGGLLLSSSPILDQPLIEMDVIGTEVTKVMIG